MEPTTKAPAIELEVMGASRYPLRLTECAGSGPMHDGERILVRADVASVLVEKHPGNLRVVGRGEIEGIWRVSKAEPKASLSPVATAAAAPVSVKARAGNKTMAGKPAAEAKA